MSAPQQTKNVEVPEWDQFRAKESTEPGSTDAPPATSSAPSQRGGVSLRSRFDRAFPPHRKYVGLRRKWFLVGLLVVVIILLALIIGLAVGLTQKNKSAKNLPLPSNSQTFTGDLTYYGPGLGACGVTSGDNDMIVSVSHIIFDAASTSGNPNANPLCGRKIRASRFDEQVNAQRSLDLTVVDRCTGCQASDLDTSPGAFDQVAAHASGRVSVTWAWLPAATGS